VAASKLYRTLWRWHFYAGLFCIPFILSLSITGAIFLFKPQIMAWTDRAYQNLEISGERASPQAHIQAAKDHLPGAKFSSYRLPETQGQAVVVTLMQAGQRHLVYVHPHSLDILKSLPFDNQFIRIVRKLHGELLLGNSGSLFVELAGCWALVLIITGLYLWWPRSATGLAGVVYPRIRQGGRTFWRDLHAVTGFWVSVFTLFLIISGLPWALVWGSTFKEIRSIGKPDVSQDWTVSASSPQPSSAQQPAVDLSETMSEELLQKAHALNFSHPVELGADRKQKGVWKLSSGDQNRMNRADAWFDSKGELIKVQTFSDRQTIDKVIGIGISAHEGHLFGWLNQLLGLLTTLGLILVSVSGFILWRKRKPDAVLGAPKALPNKRVGQGVFYITLVLSVLLPVVAGSLVIIALIEKALLPRMPRVKAWLGA